MKHFFSLLLLFSGMSAFAQVVDIPDAKFREALLTDLTVEFYGEPGYYQPIDKNHDGLIQTGEAANVKTIYLPSYYGITSVEGIAYFTNLHSFESFGNFIDSIDLKHNKRLQLIKINNGLMKKINIDGLDSIISLNLSSNKISSLNINHLNYLEHLNISDNLLDTINLSNNPRITTLDCSGNKIKNLYLNNQIYLSSIHTSNCPLNAINLKNLPALSILSISYTSIDTLRLEDLPNLNNVTCHSGYIKYLSLKNLPSLEKLYCNYNKIQTIDCSGAPNLKTLDCSRNLINNLQIGQCTKLTVLDCSNNKLLNLNTDSLNNLITLKCGLNFMLSPKINKNIKLRTLDVNNNFLSSIDIENNINIEILNIENNQISSIEINHLKKLQSLNLNNNILSDLKTDSLYNLMFLYLDINQLNELDLSQNTNLIRLSCVFNKLKSLDLNRSPYLRNLDCSNNLIEYLNIKNTSTESENLNFNNNPNLQYICCDAIQLSAIQQQVQGTQILVGTYCNFEPGGLVFNFQSHARYDADMNNCSSTDPEFKIKYELTDSTGFDQQVIPFDGELKIALNAGKYKIKPIFDTVLFNIEPKSVAVDFPAMSSPHLADFCLAPINVVHDLEVALMPTTPLRPGFDARFKLVCTNKGNQTTAGSVSLVYDEDRLDFISSDISASTQNAGFASWNFTDLLPNATFEVEITFNCNSPVETPAVNIGDILSFYAEAIGLTPETTPANNTFALRQTVVGSYDPNDKTCLQGERLDPDMVGQYVHYLIRFENTGTYPAEFVVVKDVINPGMFDINTLEIIDASHPMYARTSDGNVVEFIFENINLPFDDANNDGYVAFKIKTQPWLKIGDTLANTAAIYFDYNHPIITNTAQTVVAPLVDTQAPGDPFAVQMTPNPATNRVYFQSEAAIERVTLSSTEGRLLYSGPLTNGALSLENVAPGVYWVRVFTETGTQTLKLIKS